MPEPIEPSVGIPTETVTATGPLTMHESTVPARPSPRRRSRIDLVLILAAILAFGGIAFAAGRYTAPAGPTAGAAIRVRVAETLAGRSGPAGVRQAGRPPGWLVNDLLDERELVRRCAWGSEWAQREVIRTHRPRLYLIAYHLTGHRGIAEGIVEDALVVAFRSLERADPRPSLEPWLNTIVVRTAARAAA